MRIHELTQWEIQTLRNDLQVILDERYEGTRHRRVFFYVKDEDEADGDDITFKIEGNTPLKMPAIK